MRKKEKGITGRRVQPNLAEPDSNIENEISRLLLIQFKKFKCRC
jgi:hypothetical protein